MPNVSGDAALDVLIGLFFLYFLLSIVCSSVNEALAVALRLRSKFLERGIESLLDGETNAKAFYAHWRVQALIKPPGWLLKRERKPSYMPARVFALSLLDTFAPPREGAPNNALVERARKAVAEPAIAGPTIKGLFEDALLDAHNDGDKLRASLEQSFDEVMDRASGWYKRRVQAILFAIALALVIGINADSDAIGQRLWKDDALRSAVVTQADKAVAAGQATCTPGASSQSPANQAADCVSEVKALNLPLGWSHATAPHNLVDGLGKTIGLLITAFALTLGAPFWFDLLGKVASLRGSGPGSPGAAQKSSDATALAGTG